MTFEQALDYIYSRRKFQKSSGHERIERLLELLGNPHKELSFVHVAGTNGKGSVSTALSLILTKSGYRTGLFTSPFVVEFGERIQVDGKYIPHSEVADITALIKEKADLMEKEELYPTVFEITTALAFCYYKKCGCDIVVLEAGIGGEKDSTNVISAPEVAVITSVSLDHTEMLGETVREIAREKSGIIKNGCPVVSYPFKQGGLGFIPQHSEAAQELTMQCEKRGSMLHVPDAERVRLISCDISGTEFVYDGIHIRINVCGKHQIGNMLTVISAVGCLREGGYRISDSAVEKGIAEFSMPGRTEIFSTEPMIIFDGGHNEGCMRALRETAESFLADRKITLLMAFMKDKDYLKAIEIIAPVCENMVFTCVDSLRGEKADVLIEEAKKHCKNVYGSDDISQALSIAAQKAEKEVLIVTGSFYLVSEIRENPGKYNIN